MGNTGMADKHDTSAAEIRDDTSNLPPLLPRPAECGRKPVVLSRTQHDISRKQIDEDALRILYRLKSAGYEAYVVGGAIRDILGGATPKDVDIATDATPNEVRDLFRNSRIIGRRFKIVHVFFGDKNIEVATLRRQMVTLDDAEEDLYINDDNHWGTVETDAYRRDFTINSLYYDIRDFALIDYMGGIDDIEQKIIRSIGDPEVRFQEDPVRILRAIKFAARFGFNIHPKTDKGMRNYVDHLSKASEHRVTEELFRILKQRNCQRGLGLLREYGVLHTLWYNWIEAVEDEGFEQVSDFLARVDDESKQGRYVPVEIVAAGLFLPFLGTVDHDEDSYHNHAAMLAEEIRVVSAGMDIPKRLLSAVLILLRGQLYMLYHPHRSRNVQRFVARTEFDWIWRLHELAFSGVKPLQPIQEVWLRARERLPQAIDAWTDTPDSRDIFSFRGKFGGGRNDANTFGLLADQKMTPRSEVPHGARRRRRRRRH